MPDTKYIIVEVPENYRLEDHPHSWAYEKLANGKEAVHVKSADGLEYYVVRKEKE